MGTTTTRDATKRDAPRGDIVAFLLAVGLTLGFLVAYYSAV